MRTIRLTSREFIEALQGKNATPALPKDIELLDLRFDLQNNEITAIVRSENFEDIPEEYPIPEYNLIITRVKSAATSRVMPQPMTISKTETVKKPQRQMDKYASEMAEEFSPEQRELLSFTVSGDKVIVKPIQFLKAEWEEINETVKSLGGRWVKGDIVSYWAIPVQQS